MGKKLLSLILCLLFCCSALFIACGNDDAETSSQAAGGGGEATDEWIDKYVELKDFKWEGEEYKEFHMLILSNEQEPTYYCEDVVPDLYSTTDLQLNEAVKKRNDEIFNRYGVTIVGHPVKNVQEELKLDSSSNSNLYDAAQIFMVYAAPLAQDGYLYNLKDLEGYLHLDQAWWDQNANEALSIGNKLFFTTGDISIMQRITSVAVTFNKRMLEKNFPDVDLYQKVKDKEWTFDLMVEMATQVTADTDGVSGYTYEDTWGLSAAYGDANAFFIGAGKNYVTKDANDLPVISFNDQSSTVIAQKILENLQVEDEWVWLCNEIPDNTKWQISLDIFGQNRALFRTSAFSAIKKLRAYDDAEEFGLLPLPLVSDTQEEYYTYASAQWAYGTAIPTSLSRERAEFAAYMLDAMAFGGMKYITPAYYDTTLKYRDLKDDESMEMLDIIFGNVVYDIGIIYNFGKLTNIIEDLMAKKSPYIASAYETHKNVIQSDIDKCVESYNKHKS